MRLIAGAMLAMFVTAGVAQQEGPAPTSALVRVQDKRGVEAPKLDESVVKVKLGSSDRALTGWQPILSGAGQGKGAGVDLAILIDDGLQTSFGRMLGEMQSFVQSLPPDVSVGVGYMQNGRVLMPHGFTNNHGDGANDLRMVMGGPGASASPYFCLSDFVKKWAPDGRAHVVLMISSGIDPYNGSTSVMNQDSPYVATALTDAQKAGVAVYSIYFTGAFERGARNAFSGQGYLTQVSEGTGGVAFYLGNGNPPTFGPFLKQFTQALHETYKVSFDAGGKGLQRFKVSAPNVKVVGPELVMAGAGM